MYLASKSWYCAAQTSGPEKSIIVSNAFSLLNSKDPPKGTLVVPPMRVEVAPNFTSGDRAWFVTDRTFSRTYNPVSPYLSSISLEEAVRVLELSRCQSSAALVVFAACLGGIGDNTIGNDVEGFAHTVLGTGAMAFIGALWEVDDVGTMILMVLFYRALIGRLGCRLIPEKLRLDPVKNRTLAALWRAASLVFYYLNKSEAKDIVKGFIIELDECHKRTGNDPNKVVKNWKSYLEDLLFGTKQPDGTLQESLLDLIDFKHPFFYASFIPVGYGDLEIALPESLVEPKVHEKQWSDMPTDDNLLTSALAGSRNRKTHN